jgi:hypothetical protein
LGQTGLSPEDVLAWEFEYARVTVCEAMNDRRTVVNFYLLLTRVVASAVAALVGTDRPTPQLAKVMPYIWA